MKLHLRTLLAFALLAVLLSSGTLLFAQAQPTETAKKQEADSGPSELMHQLMATQKAVDDMLWYQKLSDIADIDKIRITSSKPARIANSTSPSAGNPLIIYAYTFVPKKLGNKKAPMLVLVHGGVHGDFTTASSAHIVRELINQGYIITAPEYRGSTSYGKAFYDQIDYGGAEIDDTHSVRDWAVQNMPQVDAQRVGIIGWSHGGYHALMNIIRWPKDYKVAYAGVPVSDLVMRMGYLGPEYNQEFARFIGKTAVDNPMEYRRRSPVFHVAEIQTPLLVHTNTNDDDVNVMEVEHLIAALKAAGKNFEYKIYQNAPGSHQFNRIDTPLARQSRQEIYEFLAKYLKP